ncbi:hypothetical protein RR47_GL002039 [Enterococcus columbae DSM 7374 = ATCC 51263]|nr:hypothetical protein RR47_GL002039 [Enterococcus columbae DSM 7374 = ATCC 51263]
MYDSVAAMMADHQSYQAEKRWQVRDRKNSLSAHYRFINYFTVNSLD